MAIEKSGDDGADYSSDLLQGDDRTSSSRDWRLNIESFRIASSPASDGNSDGLAARFSRLFRARRKETEVYDYYREQERLLQDFNQMETIHETGSLATNLKENEQEEQDEVKKKRARKERLAINISNIANLVLFAAKVFASIESRSMAVIASTLDSLMDLLSGLILLITAKAMRKPNRYRYPVGKRSMQPMGISLFAAAMAFLGLQVLFESGRQLVAQAGIHMSKTEENWMIGIMVSVTAVKFLLMVYCRRFQNKIVRAYAQDHLFDVITNSVGLATAVLAVRYCWWIDPTGAIIIALYTVVQWTRTLFENVKPLLEITAPPEFLNKLTFLIWNHHEEIKHIDTVRAYTMGTLYLVEVDIVLPKEMKLLQAHDIGETLQEKLEQLPEVLRAYVHMDIDCVHRPEHKDVSKCGN